MTADERSDLELIQAYEAGDAEAFEALVARYLGPVYRFVCRMVRDEHEAEDLTQDAFVNAWKSLSKFDRSRSFKTWLFAIARNVALDDLRKKRPIVMNAERTEDGEYSILMDLEDPRPLPDELVAREEGFRDLEHALDDLPPKAKAVILLHDLEDLTFQEIADATREPMNTVKSRYRRAVELLRTRMTDKKNGAEQSHISKSNAPNT